MRGCTPAPHTFPVNDCRKDKLREERGPEEPTVGGRPVDALRRAGHRTWRGSREATTLEGGCFNV